MTGVKVALRTVPPAIDRRQEKCRDFSLFTGDPFRGGVSFNSKYIINRAIICTWYILFIFGVESLFFLSGGGKKATSAPLVGRR